MSFHSMALSRQSFVLSPPTPNTRIDFVLHLFSSRLYSFTRPARCAVDISASFGAFADDVT